MQIRKQKLKPGEIVPMTFDYVFTSIFNNENNIDILEQFLACYLKVPKEQMKGKVQIQSRNLKLEHKKDRNIQIDLLVDIEGKKVNIELSNQYSAAVLERNVVSVCNIHSRQLKYGDNTYTNIHKTLQIELNNFRCNENKIRESYLLRSESGNILSQNLQIDIIDMALGSEMWYTSRDDSLARWCKAFTANTKKELKNAIGDDLMEASANKKLIEEVDKYSMDEEVIGLYMKLPKKVLEQNTYIEEAKIKGIKEGRLEGRLEEKYKIAKNLKNIGIDMKIISENTGLSLKEVEAL